MTIMLFIQILSVALVVPMTIICGAVVIGWRWTACPAWKKPAEDRLGFEWLIMGINTNFSAAITNAWWWGLFFGLAIYYYPAPRVDIHNPADFFLTFGALANIITRLIPYCYSGYLHLKGKSIHAGHGDHYAEKIVAGGFAAGALALTALVLTVQQ